MTLKILNFVSLKKNWTVGTEEQEEDPEAFEEKMKRLTADLADQFKKSAQLEVEIKKNLKGIGFEIK